MLIVGVIVLCYVAVMVRLLIGFTTEIASVDVGDSYQVHLWDEQGLDHHDIFAGIYLEVTQSGETVIPQRFIYSKTFGDPYQINVVYADDGQLVCVYDTNHWEQGVYVFFDARTEEVLYGTPTDAWLERYEQLREENPDMPPILD